LSSQTVLLMNIRQQNSTQNVQTHIFLTKYIFIKPIHNSNNV